MPEREILETDVLVVGAGPAGLAAAIRLADLASKENRKVSILVIEKAREVGAHAISGAVMDPRALAELIPDFEAQGAPAGNEVLQDDVYFLREDEAILLPVTPPPLRNEGNRIVSLGKLVRWLATQAEQRGIDVFPAFGGDQLLVEGEQVVGVRVGDKGVDKHGKPRPNFEAGVDIRAKVTILSEGSRGHLTRQCVERFRLDKGRNPQIYATGVKEIWEMPSGRVPEGHVVHTMGWPLKSDAYGGGFLYSLPGDRWSVGFVVGLDYRDPFLDPHHELQRFKTHPKIRALLEGGKMVEYGAKTIPEGGWLAVPKLFANGCLLAGDAAGLLDASRLKGIHLAIRSGMSAGETALDALRAGDFSERVLAAYARRIEDSYVHRELWKSRYFKHGFKKGFWAGMIGVACGMITGGWSPFRKTKMEAGHREMRSVESYHGRSDASPVRIKFDGTLTFDKLTDLYQSGTTHTEDSPCHLKVLEPSICVDRCTREYGNPCQHFCPASVYEWVKKGEKDTGSLMINFSNCVHCKTCDIMDPYGIIRWVPPEGGGGPGWKEL